MNQISLCSKVISPNGDCQFCLRNPAITKPSDSQTWIMPDYILKGMGEDDCMDFVFKQNKELSEWSERTPLETPSEEGMHV